MNENNPFICIKVTSFKVQNQLLMAIEARTRQAITLLLGLRDPNSPLSLVDTAVVRLIMEWRSAPIHVTTKDGCLELRDPDTHELQSFGDLPAVVSPNEYKAWFRDGKSHRDGGLPAEVWADGSMIWYRDGELHRDGDLPAVVWGDGYKAWYRDGKKHRDGDLPAVIMADGGMYWYRDGKIHRGGDLPAVEYPSGAMSWYRNGLLHRDGDKPADVWSDGTSFWYYRNDVKYTPPHH